MTYPRDLLVPIETIINELQEEIIELEWNGPDNPDVIPMKLEVLQYYLGQKSRGVLWEPLF